MRSRKFKFIVLVLVAGLILSSLLAACTKKKPKEISYYTQIPGVTAEEIAAIEAAKAQKAAALNAARLTRTSAEDIEMAGMFCYTALLTNESWYDNSGVPRGFTASFCDLLQSLFGIKIHLEIVTDWDKVVTHMAVDDAGDFCGEFTYTEKRAKGEDENIPRPFFTSLLPISQRGIVVFMHSDKSFLFTSEMSLIGKKVAFLEKTMIKDAVCDAYGFSKDKPEVVDASSKYFDTVWVPNYHEAERRLLLPDGHKDKIDAFINESADEPLQHDPKIISKNMFPMVKDFVGLTTLKPELSAFISVFDKYLLAGGDDIVYGIGQRGATDFAKQKFLNQLSEAESVFIYGEDPSSASNGAGKVPSRVVKVAYELDNYPVCFLDKEDGRFKGIAVDLLDEISKVTGIKFIEHEASRSNIWEQIMAGLVSGDLPMTTQLIKNKAREDMTNANGEKVFAWTSEPYSTPHYVLISKSSFPNLGEHQISSKKICVVRGTAYDNRFTEIFYGFPPQNLLRLDDFTACKNALEHGQADLMMTSEHTFLDLVKQDRKADYKINIKLAETVDSRFGFSRAYQGYETLISIIDKAQGYIDLDKINNAWEDMRVDYAKDIEQQATVYLVTLIIVSVIAFVLGIAVIFRFISLKRQLAAITMSGVQHNMTERANRSPSAFGVSMYKTKRIVEGPPEYTATQKNDGEEG